MGRGIAASLAKQNFKVVIADWNEVEGKKVADEIKADFYKVDVTSWADQYNAFDKTFEKYGRVDFGTHPMMPPKTVHGLPVTRP